jgi:hypothetical protein
MNRCSPNDREQELPFGERHAVNPPPSRVAGRDVHARTIATIRRGPGEELRIGWIVDGDTAVTTIRQWTCDGSGRWQRGPGITIPARELPAVREGIEAALVEADTHRRRRAAQKGGAL